MTKTPNRWPCPSPQSLFRHRPQDDTATGPVALSLHDSVKGALFYLIQMAQVRGESVLETFIFLVHFFVVVVVELPRGKGLFGHASS